MISTENLTRFQLLHFPDKLIAIFHAIGNGFSIRSKHRLEDLLGCRVLLYCLAACILNYHKALAVNNTARLCAGQEAQ